MTRRPLLTLGIPVLAVLTLSVAACSGDDSGAPPVSIPPGALTVYAGPGLLFDKSEYSIAATDGKVVVALVQRDSQRHTLLVKAPDGIVVGEKLEVNRSGETDLATFTLAPGEYELYCDVPGHNAMRATLTVT